MNLEQTLEALDRAIRVATYARIMNSMEKEDAAALQSLRDRLDAEEPWGYVSDTEWLPGDAWGMTVVKQPTNYRSVPVFLAPPAPAASRVPDGDMRDAFHKWARGAYTEHELRHDRQGVYFNGGVQERFGAWCAALSAVRRLAAAPPAPAAPAAPRVPDASIEALRMSDHRRHLDDAFGPCLCSQCKFVDARDAVLAAAPAAPRVPDDELRAAANALLHQIDIGDFVDSHGHSAKMLKPVHDLMRLLAAAPPAPATSRVPDSWLKQIEGLRKRFSSASLDQFFDDVEAFCKAAQRAGRGVMNKYAVWCEDYGQDRADAKTFEASAPYYAAEKWAEWRDAHSADYTIVNGTPAEATVECLVTGERTVWIVHGEAVPSYSARLKFAPPQQESKGDASPCACWPGRMCSRHQQCLKRARDERGNRNRDQLRDGR